MQANSVEALTFPNKINNLCTVIEVREMCVYSSAGPEAASIGDFS